MEAKPNPIAIQIERVAGVREIRASALELTIRPGQQFFRVMQ
jgi:hypothetical protein